METVKPGIRPLKHMRRWHPALALLASLLTRRAVPPPVQRIERLPDRHKVTCSDDAVGCLPRLRGHLRRDSSSGSLKRPRSICGASDYILRVAKYTDKDQAFALIEVSSQVDDAHSFSS